MKKFILKKIQKGFTPMELLLVIGISAVVAGLFVFTANAPRQQAALPPINVNVEAPNITVNPPDVNVNVEPARVTMTQPDVTVNVATPRMAQAPGRTPGAFAASCGDGVTDAGEKCDDGAFNGTAGHCDDICSGYTPGVCGDFVTDQGEQCDDGGTSSGDGCSASCTVEVDYACIDDGGPNDNVVGTTCTLSPSNDTTGVTDVANLQSALYWAVTTPPAPTRTVHLTSDALGNGDYYVSRNVVVDGFNGTLKGEGMDSTTIFPVRRYDPDDKQCSDKSVCSSNSDCAGRGDETCGPRDGGFSPAYSDVWNFAGTRAWGFPLLGVQPIVLQFDNSAGLVTIADLTIHAEKEQPIDVRTGFYGRKGSTGIFTLIDMQGGTDSLNVHDVRLLGTETDLPGNWRGTNVEWGIHNMDILGWLFGTRGRKPSLTLTNIEVENVSRDAIEMMDFDNVSMEGLKLTNNNGGTFITRIGGGTISNSEFSISREYGIYLGSSGAVDNLTVSGNTFTGKAQVGIYLRADNNNIHIKDNTFENLNISTSWGAPIYVRYFNTNSTIANNTFVNITGTPSAAIRVRQNSNGNTIRNNDFSASGLLGFVNGGKGAILLDSGSYNNHVIESVSSTGTKFPLGTSLCTPQVLDDGDNNVSGYAACANNSNWASILEQLTNVDPGYEEEEEKLSLAF